MESGIRVTRAVLDGVIAHARVAAPAECCGVLLGHGDLIVEATRARNAADDPTRRYLLDPQDHIESRRQARGRGLAVVGFYHSHPASSAEPSASDLAEATYPDHLYLIVSLSGGSPQVNVFRLEAGNFRATPFVTVG